MISAVLSTFNEIVEVKRNTGRDKDLIRTLETVGSLRCRIEEASINTFSTIEIDTTLSHAVHLIDSVGIVIGDTFVFPDASIHEVRRVEHNTLFNDGTVYATVYV